MSGESANPNASVVETIFNAALSRPSEQREAYLALACGNDLQLRQRVQALLAAHDATQGFLPEQPLGGSRATPFLDAAPTLELSPRQLVPVMELTGDRIGRYKLLEQIGEGGCGVVYLAEQEQPVRRRVAVKVIRLGMETKQVIARFEAERQALALMDHPNIAKVLCGGHGRWSALLRNGVGARHKNYRVL